MPATHQAAAVGEMLRDARCRTLALIEDLTDEQLLGPALSIVNPLLWEIGHVAWFQERWILRHRLGRASMLADADALYDSAAVAHGTRWTLPLPSRRQTCSYMQNVLDAVLEDLQTQQIQQQRQVATTQAPLPFTWNFCSRPFDAGAAETYYYHLLSLFHEDMHGEAFVYTRQTHGWAQPLSASVAQTPKLNRPDGIIGQDARLPGGTWHLGATESAPFVFDNEKWAHRVEVKPFVISKTKVTNGQFQEFVDAGGYQRPDLWSQTGWRWRQTEHASHPRYWCRTEHGQWWCRWYDQNMPLELDCPVIFVNWYEADAYCRWAGRRLPTEAEWEMAACGTLDSLGACLDSTKRIYPWGDQPADAMRAPLDLNHPRVIAADACPAGDSAFGCRQMLGNAWEWCADDFEPYPGFDSDSYREYSQPWFGPGHKVLRGAAFATRFRLVHNTYRNFYAPHRRDVLAGFRTCRMD